MRVAFLPARPGEPGEVSREREGGKWPPSKPKGTSIWRDLNATAITKQTISPGTVTA